MKNLLFITLCFILTTQLCNANTFITTNLNDAGNGSLRDQINQAADEDTIRFDQNLIANGSATIELDSMISFSKFLTIIGIYNQTDTLYLTSSGTDGVLQADLTNVIYYNQKLIVDSLVIKDATTDWLGGAISVTDGFSVEVRNSHFYNNHSDQSGGAIGCIHWDVSTVLDVENCTFESNTSQNDGAAIYVHSDNTTTINVNNSRFINNSAVGAGGAIRAWGDEFKAFVTTINSEFDSNSSGSNGGAILANSNSSDGEVQVEYSTFVNNQASGTGGAISVYGMNSPIVSSYQSTFTQNQGTHGGAIHCFNSSNFMSSIAEVEIINSTLFGNVATTSGGAVYADSYAWGAVSNEITTGSSIIADNGSTGLFTDGDPVVSLGYNFFGGTPGGTLPSDVSGVTVTQLDLGPLQLNGGTTQTLMPNNTSIVIDAGDPTDMIDAQNTIIIGVRDAGATEYCAESSSSITADVCDSYMVPSGDEVYTISGVYNDTIPNLQGCDSVLTITLTVTQIDTSITVNGSTLTSNQSNVTYQWIDCGNGNTPIMNETNSSYTPQSSGSYAVVIDNGICTDTSTCYSVSYSNIDGQEGDELMIYPNPVSNLLNIELTTKNYSGKLIVINTLGAVVSEVNVSNTNKISINTEDWAKGMYMIRLQGETVKTYRVVKK